jgi:hypothetical protein
MMNEVQRQVYLSALGVDSYMPRWHLPFAPESLACKLPETQPEIISAAKAEMPAKSSTPVQLQSIIKPVSVDISPVNGLMGDIFETKKVTKTFNPPISAADILAHLDSKQIVIDPFSLSIWRPVEGVMIVDSRNTKLALPTELLLNNTLRSIFSNYSLKSQEEVLRWPMIENSFTKRTADDARNELQTWLSVQHEIRPIHYLWLMGANAASYLLPETISYSESLHKVISFNESSINGVVLPSLNELLQKPALKQQFFSVLRAYHSTRK